MAVVRFADTIANASITTIRHLGIVIPENEVVNVAHDLAQKFFEYDAEQMSQFTYTWMREYCTYAIKDKGE